MSSATPVLEINRRRPRLVWPGLAELNDLTAVCRLDNGSEHFGAEWIEVAGPAGNRVLRTSSGPIDLELAVRMHGQQPARLTLRADAKARCVVRELGIRTRARIGGGPARRAPENGYQSWDPSGLVEVSEGSALESWWTGGLADETGRGVVVAAQNALSSAFKSRLGPAGWDLLWCEPSAEGRTRPLWDAREGSRWRGSTVRLGASRVNLWATLAQLARRGRPKLKPAPRGWLSWYQYGPWVTAEDVMENSQALRGFGLDRLNFDLVQLDDGWQQAYGDWTPNRKIEGGLDDLAFRLKAQGQRLGLWAAPFLASADSQLAASAPDAWFLQEADGTRLVDSRHLMMGPMHVLDLRCPEVQHHLSRTFAGLRGAGVDYFKIDFLYAGGYSGTRAFRHAISTIREAVGDAYVLACGSPLLPLVGLVDGCRVGPDTATPFYNFERAEAEPTIFGEEVEAVARNLAARHYLGSWFQLDADVALVGGNLDLEQARQLVTLAAISGGPFFASDRLSRLPAQRQAMLTNPEVLALAGGPPPVPDWQASQLKRPPTIWRRPDGAVAVFNWHGVPQDVQVPITGRRAVRDLWQRQDLGIWEGGSGTVSVPPQSVRLLCLTR